MNTNANTIDPKTVVSGLLSEIDAEAPGLIEGFYLTGSIALNDYRSERSDIDFVALTAKGLEAPQLTALHRAYDRHIIRHPRPLLDGIFMTWDELAAGPDALSGPKPVIQITGFSVSNGGGARNPVTWHVLAACAAVAPNSTPSN